MADDAKKRAWVARVLGVRIPEPKNDGTPLLPLWLEAKEQVDGAIGRLQGTLRGFDDPDLTRIAEFGLNGITGRASVGLMVALREADTAGADQQARKKLAEAVASYRSFLDGSPTVALIDDNPFGVSVSLRATLGGALDAIDRRLTA
jgi:hypothetical protein